MGLDGPLLLRRLEEEKIKLYCLVSVSLVTLSVALHWLGPVMVPLILAFMLSYMLSPLVDLQVQKLRCPQVCGFNPFPPRPPPLPLAPPASPPQPRDRARVYCRPRLVVAIVDKSPALDRWREENPREGISPRGALRGHQQVLICRRMVVHPLRSAANTTSGTTSGTRVVGVSDATGRSNRPVHAEGAGWV